MDISINNQRVLTGLPAQRIDAKGRAHVDLRAVLALALPLVANSAVQTVLNLTDVWFIGHISVTALAAVGAVHWLVLVTILLFSGIGMAVQTVVAQSYGGGRYVRASQAAWIALWGTLLAVPLFVLVGLSGDWVLRPFGLSADIECIATEFWLPRVAGAPFGAALWAMLGFYNGIGKPRITLIVILAVAVANAVFNDLFIFQFGWGVRGSAWATNTAQALGFALAVAVFLSKRYRLKFRTQQSWRPRKRVLLTQLRLGFPMGLVPAADLIGFALFQIMQTRLGTVDGAASQIVMMISAIAYMPGMGIAMAGTTLVGQAIGAGDRAWAARLGSYVIWLVAGVMGGIGVLLAATGPWLLPLFAAGTGAETLAVITVGSQVLWLAAAYQFFDGLNLGSGFCLRGAGDSTVPAAIVLVISWVVFIPLAHMLTFAPGQGWFDFLPALGWGAVGGWWAVVIYLMTLGLALLARWKSDAWTRIKI